jgi:cobalt/nickel transport system permease protein
MLGALAMSLELAASGTSALEVALPAMLGVHAVIGIGEALVTIAALALIRGVRPDLLELRHGSRAPSGLATSPGAT